MAVPEYIKKYPHLFQPMEVKIHGGNNTLTFKNRFFQSPMACMINNTDGTPSDMGIAFYTNMAKGGFAQIVIPTEVPFDDMHERTLRVGTKYNAFMDLHKYQKLAHAYGAVTCCSMTNGGNGFIPKIGEKAHTPSPEFVREGVYTHEMTEEEMEEMIQMHVDTCKAAKRGGFDSVSIGAGGGCHLHNFLSPRTNRRTDKYGGSDENRARYPLMMFKRIREAIGNDMALTMRLPICDDPYDSSYGIGPEMAANYIRMFQEYVDYIDLTIGDRNTPLARTNVFLTTFAQNAPWIQNVRDMRKYLGDDLKIPIGIIGKIHTADLAESILEEGVVDYIIVGRQAIADPDFVNKIREGREEDVRPCQHCNTCVDGNRRSALAKKNVTEDGSASFDLKCKVNPLWFQGQIRNRIPDVRNKKKVAVIGGGIAGMQAAIVAAERGHDVTIFEKTDALGGQLNLFADKLWFTQDLAKLRNYFRTQVEKSNITVKTNTTVTPEDIAASDFDHVILAIGSKPAVPPIPGADGKNVSVAIDVFGNEQQYGKNVVIIGGGMSACDAAIYLGESGHNVTIIEQAPFIAMKGVLTERNILLYHLEKNHVDMHTDTKCTKISEEGVYAVNENGEELFFPAENVVIAVGNKPLKAEADAFNGTAFDVVRIGDCRKVEDLLNCIHGGYDAGKVVGI